MEWYHIDNVDQIDSPALAVYPSRIAQNIALVKQIAGGAEKLRPHVKTTKIAEVCEMMLQEGITKFKCATIAEAEMLGTIHAHDVLLAYQPVGPKVQRFISLIQAYPATRFACLVDHADSARYLHTLCQLHNVKADIYIDLNVGMNRTGIVPEQITPLLETLEEHTSLQLIGVHAYDGHIHDRDLALREQAADACYHIAKQVQDSLVRRLGHPIHLVIGGTPSFPIHIQHEAVECSPGTFAFWDWGYSHMLEDLSFQYAAVLLSRIISIVDENHICLDLGHKSVAAENPLPRVHFLNAPEAEPVAQSEEHLVLRIQGHTLSIGDVLYGIPVHICPTVALYDTAHVITDHRKIKEWAIVARKRVINY